MGLVGFGCKAVLSLAVTEPSDFIRQVCSTVKLKTFSDFPRTVMSSATEILAV